MQSYYELPEDDPTAELAAGLIKGQDLNHILSLDLPSSFIFKMGSAQYREQGICPGDFVVVRRDIIPESGQLVLVKYRGKFVLRTFVFAGATSSTGPSSPAASTHAPSSPAASTHAPGSPADSRYAASTHTGGAPATSAPAEREVAYRPDGSPEFELFGVVTAIFRKLGRSTPSPDEPVQGRLPLPPR